MTFVIQFGGVAAETKLSVAGFACAALLQCLCAAFGIIPHIKRGTKSYIPNRIVLRQQNEMGGEASGERASLLGER
jgi:hypothetical protein